MVCVHLEDNVCGVCPSRRRRLWCVPTVFLADLFLRARPGLTVLVVSMRHKMTLLSPYRFLEILTSRDVIMKRHSLVMFGDITQHILPSILAEEGLIDYYILLYP